MSMLFLERYRQCYPTRFPLVFYRYYLKLLRYRLQIITLLIWRRFKPLLSCCNRRARHLLKGSRIHCRWNLDPRALSDDWRILDRTSKCSADRVTHLVNGEIAHDDTMLILKCTHTVLLCRSLFLSSHMRCLLIRLVPSSRSAGPNWR